MRAVDVDYYTDANLAVTLKVLDIVPASRTARRATTATSWSAAQATIYKKIKLHTHENVGWGKIHLPEQELHTTAYWLCVPPIVADNMPGKDALQAGLVGLGNVLSQLAPLYLMCDPRDIGVVPQVKNPFTGAEHDLPVRHRTRAASASARSCTRCTRMLLEAAGELVQACPCEDGCPSCVGPAMEIGPGGKAHTLDLVTGLLVAHK